MYIVEKIQKARKYVELHAGSDDAKRIQNDAANIFADSYEEYLAIWDALQEEHHGN